MDNPTIGESADDAAEVKYEVPKREIFALSGDLALIVSRLEAFWSLPNSKARNAKIADAIRLVLDGYELRGLRGDDERGGNRQ